MSFLKRTHKVVLLKILSLFSSIRGYNILVIILAQYLTSIYILAPQLPLSKVLFDHNLFILVIASALAIAGGYIINNFYDAEKDVINRPLKSKIDGYVKQRTKLNTYFIFNFLSKEDKSPLYELNEKFRFFTKTNVESSMVNFL